MLEVYDKLFENIDFKVQPFTKGEYEACRFTGCDFSNADLSETKFIDCSFTGCNLSLGKLTKTSFQDVVFTNCKLLGLRFDQCGGLGLSVRFENCQLNHSSFYGVKMKGTLFQNTALQDVDFTDGDLSGAVFQHANLARAIFENTVLRKADFCTATQYAIDPEKNMLKGARFSLPAVTGLLHKYGIHIEG